MKITLQFIFLLAVLTSVYAQHQDPVEMRLLKQGNVLPENLVSSRSAVIIDAHDPVEWKQLSFKIHDQLKAMGLDVVMYFYYGDLHSSPQIKSIYTDIMVNRKIGNIFWFSFHDNKVAMCLSPFSEDELLVNPQSNTWYSENRSLDDMLFEFALNVKRKEYAQSNFLIPDSPEFFEDVPLIEKTEYPSYPTQLKRLPLVVVTFPKLEYDSAEYLDQKQKQILNKYNQEVELQNRALKNLFADYPYKVEFVDHLEDKEAYKQGKQFILKYLYTFGSTIKDLLNYETESGGQDFVSILHTESGQRSLKAIPVNERVYKFYIKHTASGDAYMGRYWDADHDWDVSLRAFLRHMKDSFER